MSSAWLTDLAGIPPAELAHAPPTPDNCEKAPLMAESNGLGTLEELVGAALARVDEITRHSEAFQQDIAALSREMAELERQSASLHHRLASRKAAEHALHPVIRTLALPPAIVREIWSGPVGPRWRAALAFVYRQTPGMTLRNAGSDEKLDSRAATESAEMRRLLLARAAERAKDWWVSQLRRLRRPGADAAAVHADLLNNAAVYAFLVAQVPRLATALLQAYTNTMRWYYSMLFGKYGRWLAKQPVAPAGPPPGHSLGVVAAQLAAPRGFFSGLGGAPVSTAAASDAFSLGARPGVLLETRALPINHAYQPHTLEVYVRSLVVALSASAACETAVFDALGMPFSDDTDGELGESGSNYGDGQALATGDMTMGDITMGDMTVGDVSAGDITLGASTGGDTSAAEGIRTPPDLPSTTLNTTSNPSSPAPPANSAYAESLSQSTTRAPSPESYASNVVSSTNPRVSTNHATPPASSHDHSQFADEALRVIFSPVLEQYESLLHQWIVECSDPFALLLTVRLVQKHAQPVVVLGSWSSRITDLAFARLYVVLESHARSVESAALQPSTSTSAMPGAPVPLTHLTAGLLAGLLQLCPAPEALHEPIAQGVRLLAEAYELYITKLAKDEAVRYTNFFVVAALLSDVPGALAADLAHHFQLLVDAYAP